MAKAEGTSPKNPLHRTLQALPEGVRIEVSRILDLAASAGRLALASHGIAEKDSPAALIAWETFLSADDAAQSLSHLLGYAPVELGA